MLLSANPQLARAAIPRTGREVLTGPDPSICKVKGIMFAGRKQFLQQMMGEAGFDALVGTLSPRTASYAKTPLASSWCEFESIVEFDRAVYNQLKKDVPHVLGLIGAASAELGIGKVYKSLDETELVTFFENYTRFHSQYLKFGRVDFEKTADGGRMVYHDYPCYSPVFCASAIGFFAEAILRHGGKDPEVVEKSCFTRGDDTCTFQMTWR